MLQDAARQGDRRRSEAARRPGDRKWAALDEEDHGHVRRIPRYYNKMATCIGTSVGGAEGDGTMGMPFFPNMYVK
jgi:peptide/nickel transport system substrate-binding protein